MWLLNIYKWVEVSICDEHVLNQTKKYLYFYR